MGVVPEHSVDLTSSPAAAAQFSYHLRMAAVFAASGELDQSGSEAVLAWAILATAWPSAVDLALDTASELIGQEQAGVSEAHRLAARSRAHALALQLEGHYTSVGLHDVATLYESVAENLDTTIATLVNDG
jgi:hypothetical protein